MHEVITQILIHARCMWRYRWYALAITWVSALAGWALVLALPDVYEVKAKVHVDTESILKPLLSGLAVQTNVMSESTMMTQALLSTPHLESVARETDLDLRAQTQAEFDALLEGLRRRIRIAHDRRSNIYTIDYQDSDPVMAQRLVKVLLDTFVEDSLGANRTDSSSAQGFLTKQIDEYESRLILAEDRLASFKKEHVGMMPTQGQDYYQRLTAATEDLERTRKKLSAATNRRDALERELEGEEPVLGMVPFRPQLQQQIVQSQTALELRIQEHRRQLDKLSLRYTDKHPDVIGIEQTIDILKERQRAEQRTASQVAPPSPAQSTSTPTLAENPVYQGIKTAYAYANVEVATLGKQLEQEEKEVAELRNAVDTLPDVEARMSRLNRDYEVTKGRYEQLLNRLESARLSRQAEVSSDDIKFQVIEPPTLPSQPSGPNRLLFLTVVLIAALSVGPAIAFVLHQANPVFVSVADLRKRFSDIHILGAVSKVRTVKEIASRRTEIMAFVSGLLLLVVTYGGSIALRDTGRRIVQSLSSAG